MLTPREVAALLGLRDTAAVLGWIASGQLAAVNVARSPTAQKPRWRVRREDLDQFIARRSTRPAAKLATRKARRKAGAVIEFF